MTKSYDVKAAAAKAAATRAANKAALDRSRGVVHHKDGNPRNNDLANLEVRTARVAPYGRALATRLRVEYTGGDPPQRRVEEFPLEAFDPSFWDADCCVCGHRALRASTGDGQPIAAFETADDRDTWLDAKGLVDAYRRRSQPDIAFFLKRLQQRGGVK